MIQIGKRQRTKVQQQGFEKGGIASMLLSFLLLITYIYEWGGQEKLAFGLNLSLKEESRAAKRVAGYLRKQTDCVDSVVDLI